MADRSLSGDLGQMLIGWQDMAAVGIVAVAVVYVVRRAWRLAARDGANSCGCGDACPKNNAAHERDVPNTLVQIRPLGEHE